MSIYNSILKPDYFDKFACSASACPYTCCQDWAITIDKNTYNKYKAVKDKAFQEKVGMYVKRNKGDNVHNSVYAAMSLCESGLCGFYDETGLCSIHRRFGHGYLSHTCKVYPRQYCNTTPGVLECSLTMSCPEVARLALLNPEPVSFDLEPLKSGTLMTDVIINRRLNPENDYYPYAWQIREACVDIMQNRDHSIAERIFIIGFMLDKLTRLHDEGGVDKYNETLAGFLAGVEHGEFSGLLGSFTENKELTENLTVVLMTGLIKRGVSANRAANFFKLFGDLVVANLPESDVTITRNEDGKIQSMTMDPRFANDFISSKRAYFDEFLDGYSYILENYFVNYMFTSIFPFTYISQGHTPYQHFIALAEQYAVFRMMMCVITDNKPITPELAVDIICSVARNKQHSTSSKEIAETYINSDTGSLAYISFLIRK